MLRCDSVAASLADGCWRDICRQRLHYTYQWGDLHIKPEPLLSWTELSPITKAVPSRHPLFVPPFPPLFSLIYSTSTNVHSASSTPHRVHLLCPPRISTASTAPPPPGPTPWAQLPPVAARPARLTPPPLPPGPQAASSQQATAVLDGRSGSGGAGRGGGNGHHVRET